MTAIRIGPVYHNSLRCAHNAKFSDHLSPSQNPIEIPTSNWQKLANSLDSLEFRSNPGLIPTSIGHLEKLQSLILVENGLTGKLPIELGKLVNLRRLVLVGNKISGQIPASLGG